MRLTSINCEQIAPPTWESNTIPDLLGQEVHLWRIGIRLPNHKLSKLEELLSTEERQRANKYLREQDRIRFIIGHACTKKLISRYLNLEISQVILKSGSNGKPYVSPLHKLNFNLSHSGDWVFIAFGAEKLGVDLEKIAGNFITDALLEQCFHDQELKVIRESSDPTAEFFKFWTRKEAFLKATGIGMVDELNQFTCVDESQVFTFPTLSTEMNWHLKSFLMDQSYAVSLCAANPLTAIRFFDY